MQNKHLKYRDIFIYSVSFAVFLTSTGLFLISLHRGDLSIFHDLYQNILINKTKYTIPKNLKLETARIEAAISPTLNQEKEFDLSNAAITITENPIKADKKYGEVLRTHQLTPSQAT